MELVLLKLQKNRTIVISSNNGIGDFFFFVSSSRCVSDRWCYLNGLLPEEALPKGVPSDSKVSHYCEFNSELLTVFTSSLYIAGLVATLAAASITRRYGRRTSMLIGGTVFIAGSVFGGAASNVPMLLVNRILLGIGLGFTNQVTYA